MKSIPFCYNEYMSESNLVDQLVQIGFPLARNKTETIKWAREVRSIKNRADLIYFERKDDAIISLFAIEAKLHDWRTALRQAYRNKLFADKTFVALPEQFSKSAIANIIEFRRVSVGLILVGSSSVRIVYNPPINKSHSNLHVEKVHKSLLAMSL